MRAAIYCRISKDRDGEALGVERQEQDCRALAERLGWEVSAVHVDNDLSASTKSRKVRPAYDEMLQGARAGRYGAILAYSNSRLTRRPMEWLQLIELANSGRIRIKTVASGEHDLSTADGRATALTVAAWDAAEAERTAERVSRSKVQAAEGGKWKGGRRPFGYEADGVTIRECEAALIRQAADQVLAGESVRGIARAWNAAGSTTTTGKAWTDSGPKRVLLRARNAGLMEHRGEVIGEAKWPAILDPEKWRAVVRVLDDEGRRTNHTNSAVKWLGSGLFTCGVCRARLRSDRPREGYNIYRCREGSHVARGQADVDSFVAQVLVERLRRPDLADLLHTEAAAVDVRGLENRAVELTERKNQMAAMFAEGGIDAAQLSAGSMVLERELQGVREQIAAAYSGSALDGVASAPDPGAAWLEASLERQRLVLDALMTVTVMPSQRGRPKGWAPGESYFRPETVSVAWKTTA